MASITRRLLLYSRQCPSQALPRYAAPKYAAQWPRPLSTTSTRYAKNPKDEAATTRKAEKAPAAAVKETTESPVSAEDETVAQLAKLVQDLKALDPQAVKDAIRKGQHGTQYATDFNLEKEEDFEMAEENKHKVAMGFWSEGESDMGMDEDYFGDDLTSLGHGELQQHRELREYARLIAWELPLLNQLARPFEPPTAATPFRFRYTSYLGESHPAANKVVVEFSVNDMADLNPQQRDKLIKLAGPRYNPSTGIIKMSCEEFDTQTQNKRSLGDTIHKLLAEAKDGKDTFEDVPFDFRHHKPKPKYEFPKEWIMTPERKQYLEKKRAEQAKLEDDKINNRKLLDGNKIIETSLPFTTPEPQPVVVGGPRGKLLR